VSREQGRAGQGRAGQGRAGQGRAGQGRAGQDRSGKDRSGQDKAGEGREGTRKTDVYRWQVSSQYLTGLFSALSMCMSQTDPASRPPPTQKGRNQ